MTAHRKSPLEDRHRALGARLTPFAGWDMPLDYGSVVAEHESVRTACGVFDLAHLGSVLVTGPDAAVTVQRACTNDVGALAEGRAHYSLCLDADGGIVDDLLVYRVPPGYFVVPNAANTGAVLDALRAGADGDVDVRDAKDELVCVAVQGPMSAEVLHAIGIPTDGLDYLDCRWDAQRGILARSGYTGECGYEVFLPPGDAPVLWDRLLDAGGSPVGLGARDTLRLEMGYPLHGNDIGVGVNPVDAGLTWAVKPDNSLGVGFRGQEAYLAQRERPAGRRLRGLRVLGKGIPRAGCRVLRDGAQAGIVTSGTFSPTLRIGIALAYLDIEVAPGDGVEIEVRGKAVAAEVVTPPFVDANPRRS
jgi:aminomethyltransferase